MGLRLSNVGFRKSSCKGYTRTWDLKLGFHANGASWGSGLPPLRRTRNGAVVASFIDSREHPAKDFTKASCGKSS